MNTANCFRNSDPSRTSRRSEEWWYDEHEPVLLSVISVTVMSQVSGSPYLLWAGSESIRLCWCCTYFYSVLTRPIIYFQIYINKVDDARQISIMLYIGLTCSYVITSCRVADADLSRDCICDGRMDDVENEITSYAANGRSKCEIIRILMARHKPCQTKGTSL